jgi:hypothetical protein
VNNLFGDKRARASRQFPIRVGERYLIGSASLTSGKTLAFGFCGRNIKLHIPPKRRPRRTQRTAIHARRFHGKLKRAVVSAVFRLLTFALRRVFTGLCAEFSIIVQNSMQVDNASFGGKVRLFPLEIYPISWGGG